MKYIWVPTGVGATLLENHIPVADIRIDRRNGFIRWNIGTKTGSIAVPTGDGMKEIEEAKSTIQKQLGITL